VLCRDDWICSVTNCGDVLLGFRFIRTCSKVQNQCFLTIGIAPGSVWKITTRQDHQGYPWNAWRLVVRSDSLGDSLKNTRSGSGWRLATRGARQAVCTVILPCDAYTQRQAIIFWFAFCVLWGWAWTRRCLSVLWTGRFMVGGEHMIIWAERFVCFVHTLEGCCEREGS